MSETKFTKGPWFVSKQGYFVRYHIPGFANCNICDVDCGAPLEEREANARLIAAAPELYEVLRDLMHDIQEHIPALQGEPPETAMGLWASFLAGKAALAKVSVPRATTAKAGA